MDHVKIHKLIRSRRRTIALVVGPDATLTVRAPFETPTEFIHDLVNRKRTWITKKILEVRARPRPRNKKFVNGESFLYLGNYYRLRVVDNAKAPLVFQKEFILNARFQGDARKLLIDWYREQAQLKITERVTWHARCFGIDVEAVRITDAGKRWGSCGRDGSLNFSWKLVMSPLSVLDYVIVHELAHLLERNHSERFWRKVATMCPRYQASIKWLKQNEHLLKL
jgi:predicted metal-dependent hydrolase